MKFILIILTSLCFLISCSSSNGKIELRRSNNSCLVIPSELPPKTDSGYAITDTIAAKRQAEKDNYWNMKAQNLKEVLIKKEVYENEASQVYLVNTSKSEIFSFTVKIILDDSLKTTNTKIYKTNPGEEILVGCTSYLTDDMQIRNQTFEVVGEKKGR